MVILNFHGIGVPSRAIENCEKKYWIDECFFREIIHTVSTKKNIRITFDDGNKSDVNIALPILKQHNVSATFFISTNLINMPGYLTTKDVKQLLKSGMHIGSHGSDHFNYTNLDSLELTYQLRNSKDAVENITQKPCNEFAIPLGQYNKNILRQISLAGYKNAYNSDRGVCFKGTFLLPRNTITSEMNIDNVIKIINSNKFSISNLYRAIKTNIKSKV